MKKLTKEIFISRSTILHNDKFDYDKVVYINNTTKITIICKTCLYEFDQIPANHLNGNSCPRCSNKEKLTTSRFIYKAKLIHGNKYDYSESVYSKSTDKICIICSDHGKFFQVAAQHLQGHTCYKCANKLRPQCCLDTIDEFIKKSINIHENFYNYSEVEYINSLTPVKIICPDHGSFLQSPNCHLSGKGCKKCGFEKIRKSKKYNIQTYIDKANIVHNFKYQYEKLTEFYSTDKIPITCIKHGLFYQRAAHHLRGHGCIFCKISKGEQLIQEFLNFHHIDFKSHWHFNNTCKNKLTNYSLYFDFYLPDYNLCIEFDGIQHFRPESFSSDRSTNTKIKNLQGIQQRDNIKTEFCKYNNIKLLRIKYINISKISYILKSYLNL